MSNMEYSVAEAKKHFSELLSRVAYGKERITIAKRGKPWQCLCLLLQKLTRIILAK
jgi:PHD/YefM family antitoxin component YafN of YafNO toxin-antitoxin module